jgi:hypothetical protein
LPEELRAQLTLLEFADVLDRLRGAEELPGAPQRRIRLPLPPPADSPGPEEPERPA